MFKKELGQVISGTSLKRFEGAFDWIPVLVTFNVDVGLYFNLFLNTANFGIEGVEEGYIEPDTVMGRGIKSWICSGSRPISLSFSASFTASSSVAPGWPDMK